LKKKLNEKAFSVLLLLPATYFNVKMKIILRKNWDEIELFL
jgi:hypothetical protein